MLQKKKILITSALPYANGPIHVGHLVEYIQTDIYVRFLKLIGEDAIYCCADDAHGAPIEIAAMKEGITPEELIGRFHQEHQDDFASFHISFDSYYTTNSPENEHFSNLFFNELKKKNLIYQKEVELTFCNKCKRFLPDRYVRGRCPKCHAQDQYGDVCESCNAAYSTTDLIEPHCSICGTPPVRRKSTHYFFKLSDFSDKLDSWMTKNKSLQPEIVNYIRNWIKDGLQDWDISRDGPYFGFKIPGPQDLYYYVWLDAPIGYIASTQHYCKRHKLDAEKDYWKSKNSKIIHFIGKDIIYFHFLFWPAMLMGSGFNLPDEIAVHGFLTVNGQKMSKSRGTFFTARDFAKDYNPEYLRYYYAKMLSKKMADLDLNFNEFRDSVNNELAANIGNFCFRTLSFANKNFAGKIGGMENDKMLEEVEKAVEKIKQSYSDLNCNEAVKGILAIGALGNKYFQENEPWKLIKSNPKKAHSVIGTCVYLTKVLSIVAAPILPVFSANLQQQLNMKDLRWGDIKKKIANNSINNAEILINKVEIKQKETFPLDLKVAKIMDVKDHPNAEKLYVLKIRIGKEERQIVAGLKGHYSREELTGKNIIVVANLKPAKLRGIESQGMLLAGGDGEGRVGILTVSKAKDGESARFGSSENSKEQVTFEDFQKLILEVRKGKVHHKDDILSVGNEQVTVEKVSTGSVR
ncbi:MAG TPA: methionine--tRNA ligase [Candidatus Nanoarchaeia archaeon]|nr:methionine--tRNA ligase [Candidatus Nanoarchaeia archaeon]